MWRICTRAALTGLSAMLCFAAGTSFAAGAEPAPGGDFKLTSSAFPAETAIPTKYSCSGQDISPPLNWNDPDAPAGTWVHWVLFDLPPGARGLPENVPKTNELASGARQGVNGEPKIGYEGPCPPPGPVHHYYFKLYALDAKLALKPGATKADVEKAMKSHILGETHLVGLYRR
jgi:Raf kinase inhibitor-like YbhB/YbcL family protein